MSIHRNFVSSTDQDIDRPKTGWTTKPSYYTVTKPWGFTTWATNAKADEMNAAVVAILLVMAVVSRYGGFRGPDKEGARGC
jgi:hypothetical protein